MRFFEIREKDVINIRDGKNMGCVCDLGFNEKNGCMEFLVISGPAKVWGLFGCDSEYIIPWSQICKIGEDTILVDVDKKEILKKCER